MAQVTAGVDIAGRAAAYGMPAAVVDGNDLWAVHEAAREAVERARAGGGPTLLECRTYRHYGHSKADPAKYRPKARGRALARARPAAARARAPARRRRPRSTRSTARRAPRSASGSTPRSRAPRPRRTPTRATSARRSSRHERQRRATPRVPPRDPRRARRGARARRARRLLRRGRRRCPAACSPSPAGLHERFGADRVFDTPISELALAGAALRRRRHRPAPGLRDHVRRLHGAADGQRSSTRRRSSGTSRNEQGTRAARRPLGRRRRRALRRDPLADPRDLVPGRPGAEDRLPVVAGRGEGPAEGARSATTTRSSSSSTSACTR